MLQLQKGKQQTNLTDKINQLVFELYGLGEEEVGLWKALRKRLHRF